MSHCRAFIRTDATQFSLGRCSPAPTESRPVCRGGDRVFLFVPFRSQFNSSFTASPESSFSGQTPSQFICFSVSSKCARRDFALPQRAPDSFVFSSARPTLFIYDIYLQRRRVIKRAEAKNKTPSVLPTAGNYAVHSFPLAR